MENKKYLREKIILISKEMVSSGMNQSTSGNISVRTSSGMLITPSSVPWKSMLPDDLLKIDLEGNTIESSIHKKSLSPSSEWRLHADIYRHRKEINSIIHCHSIHATALACHDRSIPSFHYMIAVAGGEDIRCAPYATFGSADLSRNALLALEERFACLLAQHGQVAIAENLEKALNLAKEVENLAEIYLQACLIGEPKILSKEEMERVLKKFKSMNYN